MLFCDDLGGWDEGGRREAQEGGDMCIHKLTPFKASILKKKKSIHLEGPSCQA